MRFGLCVRLGVDLHVRLIEEGRRTHPAPTGGETQKREGGMEGQEGKNEGHKYRGDERDTEWKMGKVKKKEMKVVGRRQENEARTHREIDNETQYENLKDEN